MRLGNVSQPTREVDPESRYCTRHRHDPVTVLVVLPHSPGKGRTQRSMVMSNPWITAGYQDRRPLQIFRKMDGMTPKYP